MGKGEIVGRVRDLPIVGEPHEVANALRALRRRGDLVQRGPVRRVGPQRVVVDTRVVDRAPVRLRRRRRARLVVSIVVAGTGTLAGLGYWTYLGTRALLPLAERVGAVVAIVAVVWYLLGRAGACPGLHCPGCRHNR